MTPRVFISHASEDKERFVLPFAAQLRANGVDAWIDRWEMLPGDSLVQKIFEEGIKSANAVIVVLSHNSIIKPWVREEIDAAFVNKVNRSSRLIPILLDNCEVPTALQSTVWEKINDPSNYKSEFERIVLAIFGKYDKPEIGKPPIFVSTTIDTLPDLTELDTLIFKTACELAISTEQTSMNTDELTKPLEALDFSEELLQESLQVLSGRAMIDSTSTSSGSIVFFNVTWSGIEEYLTHFTSDFAETVNRLAFLVANDADTDTQKLVELTGKPKVIVNAILEKIELRGLISLAKSASGIYYVATVYPELKRLLRSGSTNIAIQ